VAESLEKFGGVELSSGLGFPRDFARLKNVDVVVRLRVLRGERL